MSTSSSIETQVPADPGGMPFAAALRLSDLEPGAYAAELSDAWSVSSRGKQHGGLMLALVAKAGLAAVDRAAEKELPSEPLAVSAAYLRAPDPGPVRLDTDVIKLGRTASVVSVTLSQYGRVAISASVTAGRLPDAPAEWAELPAIPAEPPPGSVPTSAGPGPVAPLATACDVVLDARAATFVRGEIGDPVLRGWVRPIGEQPDPLFALLSGDILPPVLFNTGKPGWAPTVQLTALVRARPAPGWMRLQSSSMTIAGGWLDEDMTVIDSAGRLVCQARQLALAPLS